WDPNTEIRAVRELTVDIRQIRKECQLGTKSRIRVQASWNSTASAVRGASLGNGRFDIGIGDGERVGGTLEMIVKGHVLRGSIALQTHVVVIESEPKDRLAATRAGSVLWSDSKEIILEGSGARFPVELVRLPSDS